MQTTKKVSLFSGGEEQSYMNIVFLLEYIDITFQRLHTP